MKVELNSHNSALSSIFGEPEQIITMDANFLIPPYRSRYVKRGFDFSLFREIWLDPIDDSPARLIVHRDSSLTVEERVLRDSIEMRIFPLTKYDLMIDNKDDRGEVKSLAYVAVKGLPYFAAHDTNVIRLIEKAEEWSTGLDNVQVVKMYELIFYLCKLDLGDKKSLRRLYKYQ